MTSPAPHIPVLLDEVIHSLAITPGAEIVDGTFGAGGYSQAILAGGARVYAFDRDPDALKEGADLAGRSEGALRLYAACFSNMDNVLMADGISSVDGVVLDIGVSSMQLDRAERGFSFQKDGPLDMRMGQDGMTAADFVNEAEEADIADIIYRYGEEHRSRRIARSIVAARPIETTAQLAAIVRKAVGHKPGAPKDPATRAFQAIRIHVNRELDELTDGLEAAERMLKPGGRLAVVTFHSLEDRIVKQFLRRRSGAEAAGSRHVPLVGRDGPGPTFDKADKAVRPSDAELARNPRSRSATLRSATRTHAAAWATGGLAA
ncbi:16S rRNA (cytosine(1402)-N(4))-methyltransferase RsmH [Sphingorhabdus sp.]|jgi:16S rRNA (cytosine1402-N4)-methyltransferase|uniref:16S rRNA (cytosine(1402)-N(4))-methyltransferase RsmH n=1 Tax=Sphingorhabdus sp. TaxID=1902408 RepID=UPI0037C6D76F